MTPKLDPFMYTPALMQSWMDFGKGLLQNGLESSLSELALERAAFLLYDVLRLSFEAIAETIDREPAACRQFASRARTHVRAARPRFTMPRERSLEIAAALFSARNGDMQQLRSLLASDVTIYADSGGKRSAATEPIVGIESVMQFHALLAHLFKQKMSRVVRYGFVNGLPGFVAVESDEILQSTALEIEDGNIAAIYVVRNPDKLQHLNSETVH